MYLNKIIPIKLQMAIDAYSLMIFKFDHIFIDWLFWTHLFR